MLLKETRRELELLYMEIAVLEALINKECVRKQTIIRGIDQGIEKETNPGTKKAMNAARNRTARECAMILKALHDQKIEAISVKREIEDDRRIMKNLLYPGETHEKGLGYPIGGRNYRRSVA